MIQVPGRLWSSWGCVQALIVTMAILFLPVPASALETGIDLLEALNLHSNYSQYIGVSLTQGFNMKIAYHLINEEKQKRNLVVPLAIYHRAAESIHRSAEFTFAATIRQEEFNSGSIISFSEGNNRYLELQSSGRKNEIRFHYTSLVTDSNNNNNNNGGGGNQHQLAVHTETFPYRLADNKWHMIALSVSGTEIQLLIDCHPLYRREIHNIPDRNFSASNLQLFVGQRNIFNLFPFKGDIEEALIIPGPHGYLRQCPHTNSQCPTCGQFSTLQDTIVELKKSLIHLTQRLVAAESRVSRLEECDCKKSCKMNNDTIMDDGEQWDHKCDRCKCIQGEIKCTKKCKEVNCKFPQIIDGECCPKCLGTCLLKGKLYEHGDYTLLNCKNCTCINGNMMCKKYECPKLTCPTSQQLKNFDGCCSFCPGEDYCSKGHACHINATCLNLNTKYTCTCHPGFQGDGFNCSDIDECAQQGGLLGNHCHQNTKCVNTDGSYVCECLPGYKRVDTFNCAEIDECASGLHTCHDNAECINTQGSYHCQCQLGYHGDGYDCQPICNQTCSKNGKCTSPGVCTCKRGYVGASCEHDLDECTSDLHSCKESAVCVNMPGWYYCKCKPGYETHGADCYDINECDLQTHSCHATAECINTDGHFECRCPEFELDCRLSCMFEDKEISDGDRVSPEHQPCKMCSCNRGIVTCEDVPCNCSTWQSTGEREVCCPQCDPNENCQHQELKHVEFRSGEQWIYQCETCECLYGEFDCWKLECPPLTCNNPLPLLPGDCCPRCEDDPCNFMDNSTTTSSSSSSVNIDGGDDGGDAEQQNVGYVGKPCTYKGYSYASGQSFSDVENRCTTCACKDGQLCCSFHINCNDNEPTQSSGFENYHTNNTITNNNKYISSKTTSSTTTTTTTTTTTAAAKKDNINSSYRNRFRSSAPAAAAAATTTTKLLSRSSATKSTLSSSSSSGINKLSTTASATAKLSQKSLSSSLSRYPRQLSMGRKLPESKTNFNENNDDLLSASNFNSFSSSSSHQKGTSSSSTTAQRIHSLPRRSIPSTLPPSSITIATISTQSSSTVFTTTEAAPAPAAAAAATEPSISATPISSSTPSSTIRNTTIRTPGGHN